MLRCGCCVTRSRSVWQFAPPYALTSACCVYRIGLGWSEEADRRLGVEMAKMAARLGEGDADVLMLAGHSLGYLTEEYDLALSLSEQALGLNPSATALQLGGWVRLDRGDPETAMANFDARHPLQPNRYQALHNRFRSGLRLPHARPLRGGGRLGKEVTRQCAPLGLLQRGRWPARWLCSGRMAEAHAAVSQLLERVPRYRVRSEARIFNAGPARDALAVALLRAGCHRSGCRQPIHLTQDETLYFTTRRFGQLIEELNFVDKHATRGATARAPGSLLSAAYLADDRRAAR